MIDVRNVSRAFGMLRAVDDVSLSVGEAETVGIIGTNGSGKTTLLNLITGYLQPTSGRIVFQGTPEKATPGKSHTCKALAEFLAQRP